MAESYDLEVRCRPRVEHWFKEVTDVAGTRSSPRCSDLTLCCDAVWFFVQFLLPPFPSRSTVLGSNSYSPLIFDCSFMSASPVLEGADQYQLSASAFSRGSWGGFACRKDSSVFQGDEWVVWQQGDYSAVRYFSINTRRNWATCCLHLPAEALK